ncbi:MAG: hypothetical protein PCFJNLEI_00164 [Verrucomicrobiae bacterium]|nr:hypothetical protein [Verrucomicrobiae bacterium]
MTAPRIKSWAESRFGMFIHWGLYAQLGRGEWVMSRERIPVADYEKLAATWKPKRGFAREWAALAKRAGMKYMVLTTKHHEGFLLWDSRMTDYNAVKHGPGRDLVREYVTAAREFGLKVGLYYSLNDWHHPDGARCAKDEAARRRFLDFTQGCVRELMTNYGRIDILWYDGAWPLPNAAAWESDKLNAMVRQLQPHILINDRSLTPEDFSTPEGHIHPAAPGRPWEACFTFNGSWGWQPVPESEWLSARRVVGMLQTCVAGDGNLLLNIGPLPDGSVPNPAITRLTTIGKWLNKYGTAVYGPADRVTNMEWNVTGSWTRHGTTMHYWCSLWPGKEVAIGGLNTRLLSARLFPSGKKLTFTQTNDRVVIHGLPAKCPDKIIGAALLELKFADVPTQTLGVGHVLLDPVVRLATKWESPFVTTWWLGDQIYTANSTTPGFVDLHEKPTGILRLHNRFHVKKAGQWKIRLGYDGGVKLFVDGQPVFHDPERRNPAVPDRAQVPVALAAGDHEIAIEFDRAAGNGWGFFFRFEMATPRGRPSFPQRL